MTVVWSDHAIDRLRGHIRYIAENSSLETASRWHFRLTDATALRGKAVLRSTGRPRVGRE